MMKKNEIIQKADVFVKMFPSNEMIFDRMSLIMMIMLITQLFERGFFCRRVCNRAGFLRAFLTSEFR